jgi:hypothetical protein
MRKQNQVSIRFACVGEERAYEIVAYVGGGRVPTLSGSVIS